MKLNIVDFTNPATLKNRTDGELYYIIKTEEGWDLANYVHSFSRKRTDTDQKPQ